MANHLQEIKESVSFIFIPEGTDKFKPIGTGFFVGVKNEENENIFNVYFVTAKHVLRDKGDNYLAEIVLRLNKKDGDSQLIKIALKDVQIFEHTNKEVDIVLFNCLPDQNIFDFKFIPNSLIANKEVIKKNEIAEGDEVFFAGYLLLILAKRKISPL